MNAITTPVSNLFGIRYPLIQAGMVWCSGWELASAVSNAGGLGLIGSGSMEPETLLHHIRKTKENTQFPFGVNVPLMYSRIDEVMRVIIEENVPIVFTSAGNPATWTFALKQKGIKVAHVVSNVKFALKAEDAGVDALVAEGVEAGGHNGREETTTFVLVPLVRAATRLPLIAAGGIGSGQAMAAAFALGAEGVQVGSRFVTSIECSAHDAFKKAVLETGDGGTRLMLRKLNPVRMIRNAYCQQLEKAEEKGATSDELKTLTGKGRSKKGIFEGDLNEGELEIGQVAAYLNEIQPAGAIVENMISEFEYSVRTLNLCVNESV